MVQVRIWVSLWSELLRVTCGVRTATSYTIAAQAFVLPRCRPNPTVMAVARVSQAQRSSVTDSPDASHKLTRKWLG